MVIHEPKLGARLRAALGSGVSLMPWMVSPDFQDAIDTISVDLLPTMTFVDRPEVVAHAVRASLVEIGLASPLAE